jgi:CYTH domain-containing protein
MALEIERKFLVVGDYKSQATLSEHIAQGYLSSDGGCTVRVRVRGERGFLTIKGPSLDGISRSEWEYEVPAKDVLQMLPLCRVGVIDKCRYLVPFEGHIFEVDEFYGDNEGLVVAEVELSSEDEAYVKPDFVDEEVTGDVRYYNSFLMKKPYKRW